MTSWIMKTLAKRLLSEDLNKPPGIINSDADGLDRKGNRKPKGHLEKRGMPVGISDHDKAILKKVRRRAHRLDEGFRICGFKFGVSAIVGLVPVIGDYFDFVMAGMVYRTCQKVDGGLDERIKAKMWMNIIIDAAIGLVPFLGDFADVFFRANSKNAILLEEFLQKRGEKNMIVMGSGHNQPMVEQSGGYHTHNNQPSRPQDMRYPSSNEHHNHGDSPYQHESYPEDHRHQVRKEQTTVPSAKVTKSGGGWLGRFTSNRDNIDSDLEAGEVMSTQPPRTRTLKNHTAM